MRTLTIVMKIAGRPPSGLRAALLALLLTLTGCGGEAPERDSAPPSDPGTVETAGTLADPISAAPTTAPGIRGDTVEVRMDEYLFGFPSLTLPAGRIVFELNNVGHEWHNFIVLQGDSVVFFMENDVDPTEVTHIEMTLAPGQYEVHCTIAGHDAKGMVETLTIEAAPDR